MNWQKSIALLLALNAVLVAILLATRTRPASAANSSEVSTSLAAGPRQTRASLPVTVPAPGATVVTNEFKWRQLESEDYRTYIQRLRAIGCPEATLRDIIIADLDRLFAPRLRALYPYREELTYWAPEEEELINNINDVEVLRQERALEQEKREVVAELTGADLPSERLSKKGREGYYERRLGFLPENQRGAVQQVLESYHDQAWAIRQKQLEGHLLDSTDRAEWQRLQQEKDAQLDDLLGPEQRKTFDLWLSDTAVQVRHDIYGMNATEQEFLSIFNARKLFEEHWDFVDVGNPGLRQSWENAQESMDQTIRAALGEDRFAEYKRGQDPDFHTLSAMTHRYNLPSGVAAEVYDYKQAFLDYRDAVGYDGRLSPEQKEETLSAIQEETRRTLLNRLGETAFNQYLATASWLNN